MFDKYISKLGSTVLLILLKKKHRQSLSVCQLLSERGNSS